MSEERIIGSHAMRLDNPKYVPSHDFEEEAGEKAQREHGHTQRLLSLNPSQTLCVHCLPF